MNDSRTAPFDVTPPPLDRLHLRSVRWSLEHARRHRLAVMPIELHLLEQLLQLAETHLPESRHADAH